MFEDDSLYSPRDPKMKKLAGYSAWARWRSEGTGPPYMRVGLRVLYRGKHLNEWLAKKETQATDEPQAAAQA